MARDGFALMRHASFGLRGRGIIESRLKVKMLGGVNCSLSISWSRLQRAACVWHLHDADLKSMEPYQHQVLEALQRAINRGKPLSQILENDGSGVADCLMAEVGLDGGRGRNRTFNLSIKSRMLCQLSYASRFTACLWERLGENHLAQSPDLLKITQPAGFVVPQAVDFSLRNRHSRGGE